MPKPRGPAVPAPSEIPLRRLVTGAVLALLLVLGGLALPWTVNTVSGAQWLPGIAERYPTVLWMYLTGAAAAFAAAVLMVGRSWRRACLAAGIGLAVLVLLTVIIPRPTVYWDGVDSAGRPAGGAEETSLHIGPVSAIAGTAMLLGLAVSGWRARRVADRTR